MIKKILSFKLNYFFNLNNKNIRNYSQSLKNEQFFKKFFHFGKEVQNALNEGRPIVALESALITSGLEYPLNLKVALSLEEIIRSKGAVPATITILNGKIRVGIDKNELERISEPNNNQKCSRRDLANCLIQRKIGGTTVAATMWIAHQAGIKIFSTGGIGGVHRGGENSLDISADLVELGCCPVAVVCAGIKSILDIGRTLEFLETQGVNILVLDKKLHFPGFFTPKTEFKALHCTDSLEEVADIIACTQQLGLKKGILIACPIPIENKEKSELVEKAINQALTEVKNKNICGKEVTPFVLKRISELSEEESLRLNISLLENNARIAAQLANLYNSNLTLNKEIKEDFNLFPKQKIQLLQNQTKSSLKLYKNNNIKKDTKKPKIICIGGSIVDIEVLSNEKKKISEDFISSYLSSEIIQRAGGVARNHSEALARLGNDVTLISAFGRDLNGQSDFGASFLLKKIEKLKNLDFSFSLFCNYLNTATSVSIGTSTDILQGFISIDELLNQINCEFIDKISSLFTSTDFILIDANLSSETIKRIHYWAYQANTKIWLEPTNSLKIPKLFDALGDYPLINIDIFSPNLNELKSFSECFSKRTEKNKAKECSNFITQIEENLFSLSTNDSSFHQWLSKIKLPQILQTKKYLIITCDRFGVLLFSRLNNEFSVEFLEAPKISSEDIRSVSGAGDCFNSGFLTAILNNINLKKGLEFSRKCAELSLLSTETVPDTINEELLKNFIINYL